MTDEQTTETAPAEPADTPATAPEPAAKPDAETAPDTGQDDTRQADQDDDSAGDKADEKADEKADADGKGSKAHRDAARYRTQLREAEAERDALRDQLTAMRRAEVLRVAGDELRNGEDLFVFRGDDVAGYLADDGTVDAEKVKAATAELVKERRYLRHVPPGASGGEFFGGPSLPTRRQDMGNIFRAP